ncbi:Lipopolysaccharide biosynthesis protein, LPS:glycosyltransferase [Carnobacterium iners]|uniref:Lipopolysaccharide biosynthesis protein, LPS:glycosyltransferase n=1 Tax=Carnobacterium iners TaxID=1073423 RepID=A0A1X7N373_9LACT|nr:glycosyltransferase family 8 protein [Carnobacterium iners]SEK96403.1 Lipopolysaccharide biosynthesis protein, LPS:glycosyltransferase [Carnobacterium iners]SMH31233.1 Lipopolysaccharide biosynthesis protein, LPS:glycosyltransferase [Carnobacterium iners]
MTTKKIIPIVSAADDQYTPYLSVMIMTLLEHLADNVAIIFYIIDDHISRESKEKLTQVISNHSSEIHYLEVDSELYAGVLESDHINQTAYYRISLPDLLEGKNYQKVLYIDCDVLVLDDVSVLYDTDIGENIIGAVIDPGQALVLDRLGIDTADYYFNSGLLLIDLANWRAAKITEKTLTFLEEEEDKIIYHDQDALNAILYERWFPLHPKWNVQTSLLFERHRPPTANYQKQYKEAIKQPSIVHFTGHDKPWNSNEYHPYNRLYLKELAKSPFHQ